MGSVLDRLSSYPQSGGNADDFFGCVSKTFFFFLGERKGGTDSEDKLSDDPR